MVKGCGPLGLGALAALKKFTKAKTIVALDTIDFRLDIAKRCGADVVLNPAKVIAILQRDFFSHLIYFVGRRHHCSARVV